MIEALAGIVLALGWLLVWAVHSLGRSKEENRNLKREVATRRSYEDAVESSASGGAAWSDRLRADNDKRGL